MHAREPHSSLAVVSLRGRPLCGGRRTHVPRVLYAYPHSSLFTLQSVDSVHSSRAARRRRRRRRPTRRPRTRLPRRRHSRRSVRRTLPPRRAPRARCAPSARRACMRLLSGFHADTVTARRALGAYPVPSVVCRPSRVRVRVHLRATYPLGSCVCVLRLLCACPALRCTCGATCGVPAVLPWCSRLPLVCHSSAAQNSSKYSKKDVFELKAVFDEYDKDRSGKISVDEFASSLKVLRRRLRWLHGSLASR